MSARREMKNLELACFGKIMTSPPKPLSIVLESLKQNYQES
jgi:hypothetical protein